MGGFDADTRVFCRAGSAGAELSPDWSVYGRFNGGYLSAIALRAALAASQRGAPVVSYACQYVSNPKPGAVQLDAGVRHAGSRTELVRVRMTQDGNEVLEADVWLVAAGASGMRHDHAPPPVVAGPGGLPSVIERLAGVGIDAPPLFRVLEERPLDWNALDDWRCREPETKGWFRYRPASCFDDPGVDAARQLPILDVMPWLSATQAHEPQAHPPPGRSLNLSVQFHRRAPESEWLLCRSRADVAEDGVVSGTGHVWSRDGALLATGMTQLIG